MRILYAFQGTGNGHQTRAKEFIPLFKKHAQVDILVSGGAPNKVFDFPTDYRFKGLGFRFGKKGGIDVIQSFRDLKSVQFLREINTAPIASYDLVVNDFEPVTAWACRRSQIPIVGMSHQAAVIHPQAPKPNRLDWFGMQVLERFAPVDHSIGFHFQAYTREISTPVIRRAVRKLQPSIGAHVTVYLPAYSEARIIQTLRQLPQEHWEVFSPRCNAPYQIDNVEILPVHPDTFLHSMSNSSGVICGAGFETPSEALYLGKPLLTIPMRGQFEQQCNAYALKQMGVAVLDEFSNASLRNLADWLEKRPVIKVNYPDESKKLVQRALEYASTQEKIEKTAQSLLNQKSPHRLKMRGF